MKYQYFLESFTNSSYKTRQSELPILLIAFVYAPLQNPNNPYFLYVFLKQSIIPSYYFTAFKLCIINFLLTVSPGYEISYDIMTAPWAYRNLIAK